MRRIALAQNRLKMYKHRCPVVPIIPIVATVIPFSGLVLWVNADPTNIIPNGTYAQNVLDLSNTSTLIVDGNVTIVENAFGTQPAFLFDDSVLKTTENIGIINDQSRTIFVVFSSGVNYRNVLGFGTGGKNEFCDIFLDNKFVGLSNGENYVGQPQTYEIATTDLIAIEGGGNADLITYTRGIGLNSGQIGMYTGASPFYIGKGVKASYNVTGANLTIGEVIVYNRHLNTSEFNQVNNYLLRKFTTPYDFYISNPIQTPVISNVHSFSFWIRSPLNSENFIFDSSKGCSCNYKNNMFQYTDALRVFHNITEYYLNGTQTNVAPFIPNEWTRIYIEPINTQINSSFSLLSASIIGDIADFRMYSREWTTAELNDLTVSPTDSLLAAYNFKQYANMGFYYDLTGNGNNATAN